MKNKKVLTLAVLAGLTLGGLSVSAASAQSYGGGDSAAASEATDAVATAGSDESGIVLVQTGDDADSTDADADADTDSTDAERGDRNGRRGHRGGCNIDDAAEAIGISEADLKEAIESGDTIADVAEANGVDVADVIASMVEAKAENIAEKVAEGRITQDEADEKLADLESRISDRVNGVEDEPQA